MRRDGRGSLTPLLAVIVLAAGGAVLLIGRLGGAAVARAKARTAADAAALAGAAEGRPAAEAVAAANGGRLVEYRSSGLVTSVVVAVGPARARATAERSRGRSRALAPAAAGPLRSGRSPPEPTEGEVGYT
jgi:hypothetical protein